MKTAVKVINDRIKILDKYLADTKDDDSVNSRKTREQSNKAKDLFSQLLSSVTDYDRFLKSGVNNEELSDKIRELLSTTMVPLVERNKEKVDSYKQMIWSFHMKGEDIKNKGEANLSDADRKEISYFNEMMIEYDKVKKDTIEFLEEYEIALEEIKGLVSGEVSYEQTGQSESAVIEDKVETVTAEEVSSSEEMHKEEFHEPPPANPAFEFLSNYLDPIKSDIMAEEDYEAFTRFRSSLEEDPNPESINEKIKVFCEEDLPKFNEDIAKKIKAVLADFQFVINSNSNEKNEQFPV